MKYSIDIEYFTFSGQARLHKASTVREAGAFCGHCEQVHKGSINAVTEYMFDGDRLIRARKLFVTSMP